MYKKPLLLLGLAAASLAQLAVPGWMIVRREITLREGELFKFSTAPVDPADAFRGRYVWLRLEPDRVTVPGGAAWPDNRRAYAVLAADANGFAKVIRLDPTLPSDAPAIPVRVLWSDSRTGEVHIRWPLDRFYMEEKKAPAAEAAYRSRSRRDNRDCHVTVRVHDGNAVLENLFIDGQPIRDYLNVTGKSY
ncbi:MAG: GDYXXLXY domain-containing protein [bacterium]|nr:GDYXXLXY domain-containing protein [bacterium]